MSIDPEKFRFPELKLHGFLVFVLFDISEGEEGIVGDESVYWVDASSQYEAFLKACEIGRDEERAINNGCLNPPIRFVGITSIMPVWEKPVDGAQLGWTKLEFANRADMDESVLKPDEIPRTASNRQNSSETRGMTARERRYAIRIEDRGTNIVKREESPEKQEPPSGD